MSISQVFFSTFNARHLDAEQVAETFVPSSKFRQMASPQHALLVGPRGSGKTHLLKMLQPKALASWDHPESDATRENLGFVGVFIPADEAWKQQIHCVAAEIEASLSLRFTETVFVAHFQRALVSTFLQLVHDRPQRDNGFQQKDISRGNEVELCRSLAHSWHLTPRVLSLLGIRQSLVDRMAALQEAAQHNHNQLTALLEISQSNLVACATQGIEAFNGISGQYQGRWGLLFDELEIAPDSVQRMLFSCLRSTDQRIIFKLAISPSASAANIFRSVFGPSAGNDFEEISLYADARDSQLFCESLWACLASKRGTTGNIPMPEAVLGHSVFHAPDQRTTYRNKGPWQSAFLELSKKDPTFLNLLNRKGVDPTQLDKAAPKTRSAVIRKIAPLVGFRNLLIDQGPSRSGDRSTLKKGKLSPARIYSGWEALCLISEANPRWFTGIARQLLIDRSRGVSGIDITVEQQFKVIESASQKFQDYISTIPNKGLSTSGSLSYLVNKLAAAFKRSVLEAPFVLDPVLSFEVPTECDAETQQAIIDGLYSGAFVPVGGVEGRSIFSQVLGSRLRLTFLLAPLALLPLRSGKSRSLFNLISDNPHPSPHSGDPKLDQSGALDEIRQPGLFNE